MLFDTYEPKGLLFNMNSKESAGNYAGYRGDLVLELGEIGDAHGHRKPPVSTIKNTIVLAENDKIKLYVGSLDELGLLPKLLDYYQADFAPDVRIILFVVRHRQAVGDQTRRAVNFRHRHAGRPDLE